MEKLLERLALKSGKEVDGKKRWARRSSQRPTSGILWLPWLCELEFLFTRISPEQMPHMWNVYMALSYSQCVCVLAYCFMLPQHVNWYLATAALSVPMAALIQNVYILHDVLHGATFPPYDWQKYFTHCWTDQFYSPWKELVLEHRRHHASTVDLLVYREFGWDPSGWLYVLQEWTDKWYVVSLVDWCLEVCSPCFGTPNSQIKVQGISATRASGFPTASFIAFS